MSDGTASSLERLFACPASAALPAVIDARKRRDRDRGTGAHRFVRRVLGGMDRAIALALVPEESRALCARIRVSRISAGISSDLRCEAAYALKPGEESARFLGLDLDRHYPELEPGEIAGTNDLEGTRLDGVPVVGDIKTGNDVTACEDNPQAQFHARARQLVTGADEVEARILYIRPSGYVEIDDHEFGRVELETFEDRVVDMRHGVRLARAAVLAGQTPKVTTGAHCKYCPAMPACPAYAGLARRFVPELETMAGQMAALTPEQQGEAWLKVKTIERLVGAAEDALKELARQAPLPLPNGKVIRPVTVVRNDFSKDAALALLTAKGATAEEIAGCFRRNETEQVREAKAR